MDQQETAAPQGKDFGIAGGAGAVPLVEETCGPDVMVTADEMNPGPGVPDLVQGMEDMVVAFHLKMGIVEPEIEDVPQQDEMVRSGSQVDQFEESLQAPLFVLVGIQMKMGIGHDNGRRLFQFIHAA